MRKLYEIVGLGGTFDRFHKGHEHFIKFASQFGQHLHIGITHTKLTKRKPLSTIIEPFTTRKRAVTHFCSKNQISVATSQLIDVYGPTITPDSKIRALIVTSDTISGADKINQARTAQGLWKLPVHVCPMLKDQNGVDINSAKIRAGQINREGQVYQNIFDQDISFTPSQRQFFSKPQGEFVSNPSADKDKFIAVVGDYSLENFIKNRWHFNLAIYDKKNKRQPISSKTINAIRPDLTTHNPAGAISTSLINDLKTALEQNHSYLQVNGEEDLAAVALALLLPLESRIYYGQPDQGMVEMIVTEKLKNKIFATLQKS